MLPEPLGVIAMFPFEAETIEFPLTSKSPPSWGVESPLTSDATVVKDKFPEPSVLRTCPLVPSAVGCDNPSKITLPEPFGVIDIFPLDVETILLPFTSKFPPNCGEVSPTMSADTVLSKKLIVFADVSIVANDISSVPFHS